VRIKKKKKERRYIDKDSGLGTAKKKKSASEERWKRAKAGFGDVTKAAMQDLLSRGAGKS